MLTFFNRKLAMTAALLCTMALTACLEDSKDPTAQTSDAGKVSGAYYATGLGNVALQIQNSILSDPTWFNSLTAGQSLDLASRGISPNSLGATLKSNVCPTGAGSQVVQLTWIDGRDASNKFTLKGTGTDVSSMMGELRNRVAGSQFGTYAGGTTITMGDNTALNIPTSCASASIPLGAPVIAFTIDRPAAPSTSLARTEYRTIACGTDANGHQQHGTKVESRTVTYNSDGSFSPPNSASGWGAENMGSCVDDTIVTATATSVSGGSNAALTNFAAIALRNMLVSSLNMDCKTANVTTTTTSNGQANNTSQNVNTCASVNARGVVSSTDVHFNTGENTQRTIACPNQDINTYGDSAFGVSGTFTMSPWYGQLPGGAGGILKQVRDNSIVSGEATNTYGGNRQHWRGDQLACTRTESFFGSCSGIPGGPDIGGAYDPNRYISEPVGNIPNLNSWVGSVCGICGGQWEHLATSILTLNNNHYIGGVTLANGGVSGTRTVTLAGWSNPDSFVPNPVQTSAWQNAQAQCGWAKRQMTADAPSLSAPQGNWDTGLRPDGLFAPTILDDMSTIQAYEGKIIDFMNAIFSNLINQGKRIIKIDTYWKHRVFCLGVCHEFPEGHYNIGDNAYLKRTLGEGCIGRDMPTGNDDGSTYDMCTIMQQYPGMIVGNNQYGISNYGPAHQVTMLNRDGIMVKYRPFYENGTWVVRQDGFAEPLRYSDASREKRIVNAKFVQTFSFAGQTYRIVEDHPDLKVVVVTIREWSGYDYASGTWSRPARYIATTDNIDATSTPYCYSNGYCMPPPPVAGPYYGPLPTTLELPGPDPSPAPPPGGYPDYSLPGGG